MTIDPNNPYQLEATGQTQFAYAGAPGGVATDDSSLAPGKYLITLTLNSVMKLLIGMISSMQAVAVQQANYLNVFNQWQNGQTAIMNQVHSFTSNNGDAFVSSTADSLTNVRQDLNTTNSAYTEELRSNNGLTSDTAKGIQTNINATQDAVNQQSNLATSLIQQMTAIVQAINNTQ